MIKSVGEVLSPACETSTAHHDEHVLLLHFVFPLLTLFAPARGRLLLVEIVVLITTALFFFLLLPLILCLLIFLLPLLLVLHIFHSSCFVWFLFSTFIIPVDKFQA